MSLPAAGEIHVWYRSLLVCAAESAAFFALLDPSERRRAARFHFERDRDAFIASHGWLRLLLGHYLQTDAHSMEFTVGERGKPDIHGAAIQFNLSHSGAMAAFAVTKD